MLAAQQPIRWQSQDYGASISGYVHVGKTTSNGLEIPFAISPVAAAVAKAAADEQEELELANIRDKIAHFAIGGSLLACALGVAAIFVL